MNEYESEYTAPVYMAVERVIVGTKVTRYILLDGEIGIFDADQATILAGKALESPGA